MLTMINQCTITVLSADCPLILAKQRIESERYYHVHRHTMAYTILLIHTLVHYFLA